MGFWPWGIHTGPFAACQADFVPNFSIFWSLYWGLPFLITPKSWKWEKGIPPKWMRHRGFSAWGIQTGPFAACWADFDTTIFQLPHLYTGAPISYYPRELKVRKRDSPQSGWDTGFSPSFHPLMRLSSCLQLHRDNLKPNLSPYQMFFRAVDVHIML